MSALVSVRLNDELFKDLKNKAGILHLSQTEYIRQAIERMNTKTEQELRSKRLAKASLRVRSESMKINKEFSEVEDDPES